MTSDVDTSAAQGTRPARLARPTGSADPADSGSADSGSGSGSGPADSGATDASMTDASMTDSGPADPGPAGGPRRRVRAVLLNAGALVVTTAAVAAFDAKLPRYVGD
jgi:hypothetical protein